MFLDGSRCGVSAPASCHAVSTAMPTPKTIIQNIMPSFRSWGFCETGCAYISSAPLVMMMMTIGISFHSCCLRLPSVGRSLRWGTSAPHHAASRSTPRRSAGSGTAATGTARATRAGRCLRTGSCLPPFASTIDVGRPPSGSE